MAKNELDAPITRARLIELLNEDLAREYQAIIAYVVYSQVLKGAAYMAIAKELENDTFELDLFSPEQAEEFRAEGERAIERIEAWSAPFDEGWENWLPDPAWPLPSLPNGWERL